jgi:hypothetical protein
VEGVNIGGILLGYLGVLVVGIASLAALVLPIAHLTRAARIVLAAGIFVGTVIAALATLTFLWPEYHPEGNQATIMLIAMNFLLSGIGQFVAALRSGRIYAAAFACAAACFLVMIAPVLDGSYLFGGLGLDLARLWVPLEMASLLLAAASLAFAVFLRPAPRQNSL